MDNNKISSLRACKAGVAIQKNGLEKSVIPVFFRKKKRKGILGRVDIYFLHGVRDKIFDYKANCAGNIGNISEQFNAVSENSIRTTPNLLLWGRGVFSRLSAENFLSIAPL